MTETPSMPNEIPNEILEIPNPNAHDQCDVCPCCLSLQGGFQFKAFTAFTHPGSETATMPPCHHVLLLLTGRGRAFCSVGAAEGPSYCELVEVKSEGSEAISE